MTCPHDIVELAPVSEWGATPRWHCARCHDRDTTGCDHAQQQPTPTGWRCTRCGRTLLGPKPEPHPASRR